jgi:hypothetical protein
MLGCSKQHALIFLQYGETFLMRTNTKLTRHIKKSLKSNYNYRNYRIGFTVMPRKEGCNEQKTIGPVQDTQDF